MRDADNDHRRVILTADDYAISAGVSRGIAELAVRGRLSATSAMVTFAGWAEEAARLARLRDRISVGLHLNLTVGAPLGPMPSLAPDGRLPSIAALTRAALLGRIDVAEIEAEATRQLTRFIDEVGHPPDHVDGHQHAHALPSVRHGVLAAVARCCSPTLPLLRDPADRLAPIARRGSNVGKALALAALGRGFARAAQRAGLPVNDGFSGFSAFDERIDYASELATALTATGGLHILMCHPGHVDAQLAERDPVTARREQELAALMAYPDLEARIWHPTRTSDGPPVDWSGMASLGRA